VHFQHVVEPKSETCNVEEIGERYQAFTSVSAQYQQNIERRGSG